MSVAMLGTGREAFRRHAWSEALEAFAAAGRTADLAPEDLELEGEAAWWLGDPDTATDALEQAFAAHLDAGQTVAAARVAYSSLTCLSRGWRAPSAPVGRLGPNVCSNRSRNPALTRGSRSRAQPEPMRSHAWPTLPRTSTARSRSRARSTNPTLTPGAELQRFGPDRLGQLARGSGADRRGGRSRVLRPGQRALGQRCLLQHHRSLPGRERLSQGRAVDR